MENLLVAENLTKAFGNKVALSDFSLEIPKGSIYGLLGPNGAGKTTFIRIINQITVPDSGVVYINGEKLKPSHVEVIGYMPEERGLYKSMKVGEQAIYLAQLKGLSKSEAEKRLKNWFEKLDIQDWWGKKISELSKGMGQKIQFIVTVLHEPKLLIFDEPFSGFDPVNANLIRDEIIELKNKGATVIFSTHRMESVEEMCDYVALINKSEKVLDGPIRQIRHEFKEGKFKVELEVNNQDAFQNFTHQHQIQNILENHGLQEFMVHSDGQTNNELLRELSGIGVVRAFNEVIPTMNDVFINAVK